VKTVTGLRASPHLRGRRIDLAWQNPPVAGFAGGPPQKGIRIVRRERWFPEGPQDGEPVFGERPEEQGRIVAAYSDRDLRPLTTYYYTVFTVDEAGGTHAGATSQVVAFATDDYGLAGRLYDLLPAIHQRLDVPLGPADLAELARTRPAAARALEALPPELRGRGQLRRFLHAAAAPLDLLRSFAEGLPDLHDVDLARPEFLPLLADWIGWDLDGTLPVFSQRNEIRFAPHLYRQVGTVPNLRAIVTRYTGWHTQVAELAQFLARSNHPPQYNVFAVAERPGGWRATDDAAIALGFGPGNDHDAGSGGAVARLTSSAPEPFRLAPDMELTVTADDRIPVVTRFRPGDFADIANATAAEVAAVLNRTLSELTATALTGGRLELRSNTGASLRVERPAASLVTVEGAPAGRLACFAEGADRMRLFYASADPLGRASSRIRYKTNRAGTWGASAPLLAGRHPPQADPAAVQLPDGRTLVAWIEEPGTDHAVLRFAVGTSRAPQPARLTGQRAAPFAFGPGARLLLRGNWPGPEGVELTAADFPIPGAVTLPRLVSVLDARLRRVDAVERADGALELVTKTAGGDERLEIDLRESTAAEVLGFGAGNAAALGDHGDGLDWSAPQTVASANPGRHADLAAVVDGDGGVRQFWATHTEPGWQVVGSRWDGAAWSPVETLAMPPGANREPAAVRDADGAIWLFWARHDPGAPQPEVWTIRRRVLDPQAGTWGPEEGVTAPPADPGLRWADREPAAALLPNGDLRVLFRSDRDGGPALWSTTIAAGAPTDPEPIAPGPVADIAPAPVLAPDGTLWVLFRSDRGVSVSRLATRPQADLQDRVTQPGPSPHLGATHQLASIRAEDTGTLRRFAGSTSVPLGHAARIGRRRQWDDQLAYTPQKPIGPPAEPPLDEDDFYTRGTVGLFLSQVIPDSPLSRLARDRLRAVLERFLPVNVRAVVVFAPRADIELVYTPDADIQEAYRDQHPDVEAYAGPAEQTTDAAPDWRLLLSTTLGHVSADPDDPPTLRHRTFFPPLVVPASS
jgi:phage tail-like protein